MTTRYFDFDDTITQAQLLYTPDEVEVAIAQMADDMTSALSTANPIILGVMVGGIIPMGMILPRLHFALEVDYLHATRYSGGTVGGEISWVAKPAIPLVDRHVLLIDDVLDGGVTMQQIKDYCIAQGAQHVWTAVLVDKIQVRQSNALATADFVGLRAENTYLFGYGMDYHGYFRNAPGIFAIDG